MGLYSQITFYIRAIYESIEMWRQRKIGLDKKKKIINQEMSDIIKFGDVPLKTQSLFMEASFILCCYQYSDVEMCD